MKTARALKVVHSAISLKSEQKQNTSRPDPRVDPLLVEGLENGSIPIGIVGLGYVGLPLACHLAKNFRIRGFDINAHRVSELKSGVDRTNEIEHAELLLQESLSYSTDPQTLAECRVIIVAVPTPVDSFHRPDLTPLEKSSRTVGKYLRPGTTVIYESTVYPGVTEGVCREILEQESGLKYGKDFFLGYSPERINPGDRVHTPDNIVKVVSGTDEKTTELLAWMYGRMTKAGVHRAQSIKVAEACKITENIQRDVNIALINELTKLYDTIDVPMYQVLEAARTKWNFLNFYPGLVGGHCIGVDPYYIVHLAEKMNQPVSIVAMSRAVNENMPQFLALKTISEILKSGPMQVGTPIKVAILGAAFKENVPDTRNTKVVDLARELERFGCEVHIVDEHADATEFSEEYQRKLSSFSELPPCHAMVIAVRHDSFVKEFSGGRIKAKLQAPYVVVDFRAMLTEEDAKNLGIKLSRF